MFEILTADTMLIDTTLGTTRVQVLINRHDSNNVQTNGEGKIKEDSRCWLLQNAAVARGTERVVQSRPLLKAQSNHTTQPPRATPDPKSLAL